MRRPAAFNLWPILKNMKIIFFVSNFDSIVVRKVRFLFWCDSRVVNSDCNVFIILVNGPLLFIFGFIKVSPYLKGFNQWKQTENTRRWGKYLLTYNFQVLEVWTQLLH